MIAPPLSRQRRWQARRRAAGLCRSCGQPAGGMASCAVCREKQGGVVRVWREARGLASERADVGPAPSACVRCRRGLSRMDRKRETPHLEPACCGWCAMPLTAEAWAKLAGPRVPTRALEEIALTC